MTADSPKHMDRGSRMDRLYTNLLAMGLVVDPIFADDSYSEIASLSVRVDLPQQASDEAPTGGIGAPVFGPEVDNVVTSAERFGPNVADFPAKVR